MSQFKGPKANGVESQGRGLTEADGTTLGVTGEVLLKPRRSLLTYFHIVGLKE